ncbi:MAG: LacI family DNA-binding transcriptional regulator [Bacteroidales bacterium]
MNPRKARMKDIAKLSGVSIGTVDRVLHNRGEVSDKTRKKVLKITRDLNYTPNLMAQALKTRRRYNLVSLLPESTPENSFWDKHPVGMVKAMSELEPFPVNLAQVTFDMQNEEDFQEKTGLVLKMKPEGVILAPIFKSQSISFCQSLHKQNIPFVFVDGYVPETSFLSYTGENVFQSGRVAGQLTEMVTPPGKDILIVNIAKNLQNVHHLSNRTNGFMSYFPGNNKNKGKKINLNIPDLSPKTISSLLVRTFSRNPCIASVFITGSKSFIIASHLKSAGIRDVNIIGYDLLDTNVSCLKSGEIKFLIGQRPEEQTYRGIKKLFEFLSLNKIPEKIEYLPIDVVTSENVDFFV